MLRDLAALTPPLIVGGAFLAGLVFFLRQQMGAARRSAGPAAEPDIRDDGVNDRAGEGTPTLPPGRHQV